MPKHRKFSPADEKKVRALYEEGNSAALVGRLMGSSSQTVLNTLRRMGVPLRRGGRRKFIEPSVLQRMVSMYAQGMSCEDIADKLGMRWITVNLQLKRAGVALRPGGFRRGSEHHNWAGGRVKTSSGYVMALVDESDPLFCMAQHKAGGSHYVSEHRLIMARHLGRPLKRNETVHHIDGNRQNNELSNLQLRRGRHGKGAVLVCADCGSHNIEEEAIAASLN